MYNVRKSLVVAITVIMMLAMVVPAAMAAPEWTHGVQITFPTTDDPAYVDPYVPVADKTKADVQGDAEFKLKGKVYFQGMQVDDIWARVRAVKANTNTSVFVYEYYVVTDAVLDNGWNTFTTDWIKPADPWAVFDDGWYDVEVCVVDADLWPIDWYDPAGRDVFCQIQEDALLIDSTNPGVRLGKPDNGAQVMGNKYLMIGKAWDPWYAEDDILWQYGGIASTVFQYCVITNWQPWQQDPTKWFCGPNDESWRTITPGEPTGVPDEYRGYFDSTQVPDDFGVIRFCATDFAGHEVCDWRVVEVQNRFSIPLQEGWNLISSPLMLYDDCLESALGHLHKWDAAKQEMVPSWNAIYSMKNLDAEGTNEYAWSWKLAPDICPNDCDLEGWIDLSKVPGSLSKLEHGKGYWIHMKTSDWLTFVGAWKNVGPENLQEYDVFEGWNLIGYTHWGQAPSGWPFDTKTVGAYLGGDVMGGFQQMYRYDAGLEEYVTVTDGSLMVDGAGYYLALSDGSRIFP